MSTWRDRVGDLTLFEAPTGGAFDRLNWQMPRGLPGEGDGRFWNWPVHNNRTKREILPDVLKVLTLVLWLTFLSVVLIVQMTLPRVTCLLVELVLTYPPEEVHLLKCVNKNIIMNCTCMWKIWIAWILQQLKSFLPFSSWSSLPVEGLSAMFLL